MEIIDFDLEADELLHNATILWCGVAWLNEAQRWVIYHVDTDEEVTYPTNTTKVSIDTFLEVISNNVSSAYNGISYDYPLLNKLYGFNYTIDVNKIIDPHILSRLSYPDRESHSLAYWGKRFRLYKGDHRDFSRFSNEMLQYCIQDVRILTRVRKFLQEEMSDWDWSEAIKLEYNTWDVQMRQEQRGVCFDAAKAEILLAKVVEEISEIEETVLAAIPPRLKDDGELKKIFLKDGRYTKPVEEWLG